MPSNLNTTFDWPTNFSNGTEIVGIGGVFQYAYYVTNGYFGIGILLVIFLMSMGVGLATGMKKALASSGFITFVFSVYFVRLGMCPVIIPIVLILITIVGALGAKSESGGM